MAGQEGNLFLPPTAKATTTTAVATTSTIAGRNNYAHIIVGRGMGAHRNQEGSSTIAPLLCCYYYGVAATS